VEYHHIPIYLIALFVAVGITAGGLSVYGAWVFRDFRKAKKRSTIKK